MYVNAVYGNVRMKCCVYTLSSTRLFRGVNCKVIYSLLHSHKDTRLVLSCIKLHYRERGIHTYLLYCQAASCTTSCSVVKASKHHMYSYIPSNNQLHKLKHFSVSSGQLVCRTSIVREQHTTHCYGHVCVPPSFVVLYDILGLLVPVVSSHFKVKPVPNLPHKGTCCHNLARCAVDPEVGLVWKAVDELVSDTLVFSKVNVIGLSMQVRIRLLTLTKKEGQGSYY